ncbi:MAG: hypothetical protein ABW008_07690, partial [Acidimicrobiales bacterium]
TLSGDYAMVDLGRGQHVADVAADDAAVAVLVGAGLGVLSEESGRHHADRPVTAVLDPQARASHAAPGLPGDATPVGAGADVGPRAALLAPSRGPRTAVTGRSAWCRPDSSLSTPRPAPTRTATAASSAATSATCWPRPWSTMA